jgi:hypothetical protein
MTNYDYILNPFFILGRNLIHTKKLIEIWFYIEFNVDIVYKKNNYLCVINNYSIKLNFNLIKKTYLNLLFEEQMFYIEKNNVSSKSRADLEFWNVLIPGNILNMWSSIIHQILMDYLPLSIFIKGR